MEKNNIKFLIKIDSDIKEMEEVIKKIEHENELLNSKIRNKEKLIEKISNEYGVI